jgi:Spy/CpxP family protein refolding chaperone
MRHHASRFAAVLFTAALAVSMAAAQDTMAGQGANGAAGDKAEVMQKLEKMSSALQLTPQQKQQVRPILMEEAPKLKALKSNTSLGPLQKAMQMRQIADATDAKLKPILTPQQYQTWEQMRAQERQQMMQKMENR